MMMRTIQARQPALTRQEAALLTALPHAGERTGRMNLQYPAGRTGFIPVEDTPTRTAVLPRQGSMAGRAVLGAMGISMPGVQGLRRGSRAYQDRQPVADCPQWHR